MTDVIRIATFISRAFPCAVPPDLAVLENRLASSLPGIRNSVVPGTDQLTGSAFRARSVDSLLESKLQVEGRDIEVILTPLGVGHIIVRSPWSDDELDAQERDLRRTLGPVVTSLCDALDASAAPSSLGSHGDTAITGGRVLWFYRVLSKSGRGLATGAIADDRLAHGLAIGGERDPRSRLAFGYALADSPAIAEVVVGAMILAFDEWLLLAVLNDRLRGWLAALSAGSAQGDVTYEEILDGTRQIEIIRTGLIQRRRFLFAGSRAAHRAAGTVLGTEDEAGRVTEQLATLRELSETRRAINQRRRDNRRDLILFSFTVVALLQMVLAVFDFVTNQAATPGPVARVGYGLAVATLAVITIVLGVALSRRR